MITHARSFLDTSKTWCGRVADEVTLAPPKGEVTCKSCQSAMRSHIDETQ